MATMGHLKPMPIRKPSQGLPTSKESNISPIWKDLNSTATLLATIMPTWEDTRQLQKETSISNTTLNLNISTSTTAHWKKWEPLVSTNYPNSNTWTWTTTISAISTSLHTLIWNGLRWRTTSIWWASTPTEMKNFSNLLFSTRCMGLTKNTRCRALLTISPTWLSYTPLAPTPTNWIWASTPNSNLYGFTIQFGDHANCQKATGCTNSTWADALNCATYMCKTCTSPR